MLIKQVSSSFGADPLEQNMTRLLEAKCLAKELRGPDGTPGGDRLRLARIHFSMGRVHYGANKMPEAIGYFQQVLEVAEELDDPELLAIPSGTASYPLPYNRCGHGSSRTFRQGHGTAQQGDSGVGANG